MNMATPIAAYDAERISQISSDMLAPLVRSIDEEKRFPEEVMRMLGAAGAYSSHLAGRDASVNLMPAIDAMASAAEHCMSTAFCMWCQDALGWYIASSDNAWLKQTVLPEIASGAALGGTGLSNPLKAVGEIEPMRLKGTRVDGGYVVKGMLPWVSNLVENSYFAIMFAVDDGAGRLHRVMAVVETANPAVRLKLDHDFVAMGGTATCNVQLRDAFIPDDWVLADPADAFLRRIRPGFVLLQTGMALGIIRNCIDLMKQVQHSLGHVNSFLERQPEDLDADLTDLAAQIAALATTPYDDGDAFFLKVLQARLRGSELAMQAAHWAQLHCGARGYVGHGAAQRRLREAYFVAIVTPATKHLRKLITQLET